MIFCNIWQKKDINSFLFSIWGAYMSFAAIRLSVETINTDN